MVASLWLGKCVHLKLMAASWSTNWFEVVATQKKKKNQTRLRTARAQLTWPPWAHSSSLILIRDFSPTGCRLLICRFLQVANCKTISLLDLMSPCHWFLPHGIQLNWALHETQTDCPETNSKSVFIIWNKYFREARKKVKAPIGQHETIVKIGSAHSEMWIKHKQKEEILV